LQECIPDIILAKLNRFVGTPFALLLVSAGLSGFRFFEGFKMQELIKIETVVIDGDDTLVVDARLLWEALGSKQQFSHWIQGRLDNYGFTQDVDFLVDKFIYENNQGFRYDYKLTTDTAKEIAMLENNETGRKVRRHFIMKEKQAARLARELLQRDLELLRFKALAFDRLDGVPGSEPISNVAKALGVPVKQMFEKMKALRWIFYRGGRWLGYANKLRQGLLCHHVDTLYTEEAEEKSFVQLRVTAKGVGKLASLVA
jgi:phage anti-repressor protein